MLLFEADASGIARYVFAAPENNYKIAKEREIDDLVLVEKLYVSCNGQFLFASPMHTENKTVSNMKRVMPPAVQEDLVSMSPSPSDIEQQWDSDWTETESSMEAEVKDDLIEVNVELDQPQEEKSIKNGLEHGETNGELQNSLQAQMDTANSPFDESNENWATQPFGWDDSELVDYESDESVVFDFNVPQLKLEEIPFAAKTRNDRFQCTECNKTFQTIYHLWRHSQQHREKSKLCLYCGVILPSKPLHNHERICKKPPSTTNRRRKFITATGKLVRFRRRQAEISRVTTTVCKDCGRGKFRSECEYFDHLNRHTGAQPYICSCGKSKFRYYTNFRNHRTKNGCPLEGSSYPAYAESTVQEYYIEEDEEEDYKNEKNKRQSQSVGDIVKTGTKKYPNGYICEYCGKQCSDASALSKHRAAIHLDRTIPCTECNQLFATKRSLNIHIKTHLTKKCALCGMTYFRESYDMHMDKYHSGMNFQCKNCGYIANNHLHLMRHRKTKCYVDLESDGEADEEMKSGD